MRKVALILLSVFATLALSSCSLGDFNLDNSGGSNDSSIINPITKGFAVYRSDTGKLINDGDNVEIETFYDFYFVFKYDGKEVNGVSITSDNEAVVLPHSRSVYPAKEGTATLTFSYRNSQTGKTETNTVSVKSTYHNTLSSIYVGNAEQGIEINGLGQAVIRGKVFAKFENNVIRTITRDENLAVTTSSGSDSQHKKVTLSYTYNGKTATVSYNVPIINTTNEIARTELKQNFKTYSQNGIYQFSPYINSTGNINILVIPIWFSDSDNYVNVSKTDADGKNQKEQIIEDLNDCIFGDPIRVNQQTLKSYYENESFGKLNISGRVSQWYETSYSSTINYYTDSTNRNNLVKDAYNWYKDNNTSDATNYDCVFFTYGATHYGEANNRYSGFKAFLQNGSDSTSFVWANALDMYGIDDSDDSYYELGDLSDNKSNNALVPFTLMHEFAHTMGAIDVYSDNRVNGVENIPAGKYSMQSDNRCGHDIFNQLALGWANPYVLSADKNYGKDSITLTIGDNQSSGDCVILTPSWNDYDSPFDEYIVLELYDETGVNTFGLNPANRTGVRVYHVESKLHDFNTGLLTADATTSGAILPFTNTVGVANGQSTYQLLSLYQDMDAVHLIRRNNTNSKGTAISYYTDDVGREDTWFQVGDEFSMEKYAKQFYQEGKLDFGAELGWTFKIDSITKNGNGGSTATITFTKTKNK